MLLDDTPFGMTNWANVPVVEHPGESGVARWRTCQFGGLRVRMVEYSPDIALITGAAEATSCWFSTVNW